MTENVLAESETTTSKNPAAIFILSPPRSGSTLLRVMLAGNPLLFAPQELELLSFDTLQERKDAFIGRNSFWLEGTVRAVMEIKGCDAEQARRIMEDCENEQLTTKQFYWLMQQWIGRKILVDKTPSYALDLEILKRAEAIFDHALYIHLLRHPYGMIRSFEESKLDQLYQVFFSSEHHFTVRELAELIWLISYQNILTFLSEVPAQRQHRVRFEDLVSRPSPTMEGICRFLGLEFHPDMLQPYKDQRKRMTDGIYTASRMLGDVKFREHTDIDAKVADKWREYYTDDFLGDVTWQVAEQLGYKKETLQSNNRSKLIPIRALPRDGSVELPLSFAQQRLWFLDQLEPGLLAYNMLKAIRLTGPLDVAALEQSFSEIVRRHEVLRSTLPTLEGQPVLVIAPASRWTVPVVDLQGLPKADWESEVQRLATEEGQRPFDLAQGLLLRTTLLKLSEDEHVLLLTVHHIVFDGWSFDVLFRELTALYQVLSTGRPAPLPEPRIQYADFARWQREWLQGEVLEAQLSYWKRELDGRLPILELPADQPRPAVQTSRGAKQSLVVSKTVTEALKAVSRQEGVTLFMTLLAAFKTLLHRYTGQDDITVGSLTAGRTRAEIERLIGFFANTLVLRTDLSGNPTFRDLLSRVRELALEAYAHQDLPFEKLVEALQPERDMSHHPVFQVMFALQNIPRPSLELVGLTMTPLEVHSGTAMFDLSLFMAEREQGLVATFEYNTALFDASTIIRMTGHFQNLLEAVIAYPEQRISDLPLLSESEQHQLLGWNETKADYPEEKCIHERFESQVERTPDRVAVVFEDRRLTYGELNRRANQLAQRLRSLGVGSEVLAGIYMEPSLEMVVGILGILKAGGAYVPLDPTYPRERLAFMLEDSRVSVLLTQQRLLGGLPEHRATMICLDTRWEALSRESEEKPSSGVSAENLAYVIYTSGSTGRPKGVQIPHRAGVNFLESMRGEPGLMEDDRLLSVTTLSFDIAGLELYLPLMVGASVTVASRVAASDGLRLIELLEQSNTTVMQGTPATWRLLLGAGWQGCDRLKILCGGEALSRELANQLLARSASLWNMYGPTETTIWSAIYRVGLGAGPVPIGTPIANTQLYILDSHLHPVPVGVPGELHIGGAGLARGYLNRPELTAEKFIADPFSEEPGARLYKTGDLARYLPDGNIEILGRMDYQVKIRGFRIELGEIEAALRGHRAIREAVVSGREDTPGDKRLVAYLVADKQSLSSISELRSFLANKLPEYMVPSAFVVLDGFPQTPNGKVDRRALPAPSSLRPDLEAGYVAPQTEAERIIATVWQEMLHLERVGIHDNFFDLGGHSLLMVQVHSKLRQAFDRNISMVEMFQYPTIDSLGKHLSREDDGRSSFQRIHSRAQKQKEAINRQERLGLERREIR
jgi:amino acid adenylation domain-containing protein